ncbi:MAG: DUF6359 domain-containing protein [Paludibacteraceae bacterium]
MRKFTFLKMMLLAVVMLAGSMSMTAQTESVIYSTGFESADGFTASSSYNNTTVKFQGPTGKQWGIVMGTASTTGPITGSQSMQMRSYASNTTVGYVYTNFDLAKVTKVTFNAKAYDLNTSSFNAYYSTDGGATWSVATNFTVTTSFAPYTFNVSPTGQYTNVRIKIENQINNIAGRLTIDDVAVYGILTTAVPPTFTPPAGTYVAPVNVTLSNGSSTDKIYYTIDNTDPTSSSTRQLYSLPITLSTEGNHTIQAVAYDQNYSNQSAIVTGNYTLISVVGDGTESNPYSVQDVKKLNNSLGSITKYWVGGYILGTVTSGDGTNITEATLISPFTSNSNMVLADAAEETDLTKMIGVQLPSGSVRTALNLVDNAINLGKSVKVYGNLQGYFSGTPGVTNTSDYRIGPYTGLTSTRIDAQARAYRGKVLFEAATGESVEIYNTIGQKLVSTTAVDGLNEVPVNAAGVLVVKVSNRVSKVIL